MARAMDIADYIILKANELNKPIPNFKLQNIMYFLNVEYLLETNHDLITDNKFEKWSYGFTIKQVHHQYAQYGGYEIKEVPTYTYLVRENGQFEVKKYDFDEEDFRSSNAEIAKFIDINLEHFLGFDLYYLVEKTHIDPQWKDKTQSYDSQRAIDFYSDINNKFWV